MMRTLAEPLQPVFGGRDPYGFSPTERSQGSGSQEQELAPRPKSKSTGSRWRLRTAEPEPPSTQAPPEPPPLPAPAPADDFEDFPAVEAEEPAVAGVAHGTGARFLTEEDRAVEEPEFRYEEAVPEEGSAPEPAQMQAARRSSVEWGETPQPQPASSKEPEEPPEEEPDMDVGAPETRSPVVGLPPPTAHTAHGTGSPSIGMNQTFKTGKVLKSLYERQQEEAKRRHRLEVQAHTVDGDDDDDNDDEEVYQDEFRNAQYHMKTAMAAERKALVASSSSKLGWLGDRLDATLKDLTRAARNSAMGLAANNPGSSPRDDEKKEETRANIVEQDPDAEGEAEGEVEEEPHDEEEEDFESDDEIAMNTRYAQRCSVSTISGINKEMERRGQGLPEEDPEEVKRQEERMKKGKARKPTTFEKAMKEEVSAYQDIMRERLAKLGSEDGAASMKATVNPAEAVKDAVLKYHQTCQAVGKMYAFEKPSGAVVGLDMSERRQLTRFVRDLKDEDPDRYDVKS